MGPTSSIGFGEAAITETELQSWQRNSRVALTPWEAKTLRRLSHEWARESQKATDPNRPPPYRQLPTITRAQVAKKLDEALG